ncbi:MAG: hypothetical protein VX519_01555 [Myxococcota bacterium]|nr:hypothetical protein [Myxococcota bacterium]
MTVDAGLPEVPIEATGPVEVELAWSGVGGLHQSYFSDAQALTGLKKALGDALSGGAVLVEVAWDNDKHRGTIRADLEPSSVRGGFTLEAGGVALGRLVPVTQALARYRDEVAGRYDIRVLSFHLEALIGGQCQVRAVGEHPPDGNEISPCVWVGAQEFCGSPVEGGVRFETDNAVLRRCFGVAAP